MITTAEAKALADECSEKLKGAPFKEMVTAGEKKWVLVLHQPKETVRLLVCYQKPFARFHLTKAPYQRGHTPFVLKVQKECQDARLSHLELLGGDRILQLTWEQGSVLHYLIFELFTGQVYLLNAHREILASTPKKGEGVYLPPPKPFEEDEIEVVVTSEEIERRYGAFEKKSEMQRALARQLKKAQGQVQSMQAALKEALAWEEKEHHAQLLKANFSSLKRGMTEVIVLDWNREGKEISISLDPKLSPKDQVDLFFKRARKLKIGLPHVEMRLGASEVELKGIEEALSLLESLTTEEDLEAFAKQRDEAPPAPPKKKKTEPKKRLPYRTFETEAGMTILAGRSDKDGDILTFSVANGLDYWFHVANYPGSHVVLRCPKGTEPDSESILDACQIALHFSKAKNASSADITMTQAKHVSKHRGAKAGLVSVSRHKKKFCRKDEARLNRLLKKQGLD